MRVLVWFTVGFTAACATSIYLGISVWIFLLTITVGVLLFLFQKPAAKAAAVVFLGIIAGSIWTEAYNYLYLDTARNYDGTTLRAAATVSDYSFSTDYGVAADAQTELAGKIFRLRLYLPVETQLLPGDRIEGDFRFRLTTNDSQQGGTYHQGDGIFLLAYVSDKAVITPAGYDIKQHFGVYFRRNISQMIANVFPSDTVAFSNALLLGDGSLLDYETDTDFKLSGIRHIIAVSGLHVSILMSVVYVLSGRRRYLSALIGIPVLFVFAAVVGFTPSVVRACIMQGLALLALALNKDYDPPTALAFAVLSMLCVNPMTVISVSFQLSCGCLVGIFLFGDKINQYLLRILKVPKGKSVKSLLIRWFSGSAAITLSTMITTTPLSAIYFGTVSLVGVLTNLLTLWVISFIFCGIGLSCIAGAIWLPVGKLIAGVVSVPIRYVIFIARLLGNLPLSAVYTCSIYIVVWLVMCYGLMLVFLLSKRKRPVLLCACVLLGLGFSVCLSWWEPGGENYQVTVFDVGQGQSVLIECDNRCYLVDCGGESESVAAQTVSNDLRARGILRLDGIFVTHYDKDHAGGIPLLLTDIPADALYLPDIPDSGNLRALLEQYEDKIYWIDRYCVLETDSMKFTMVPGREDAGKNDRSLCILFQTKSCDILITGDRGAAGEAALMEDIKLPELELLVAGHHGASGSVSMELLNRTKPKTVVISAGRDNYYGHPAEDTLYRLKLFGCSIWRTDLDGAVVFRG